MKYPLYLRNVNTGLPRSIQNKEEHQAFFRNRDPKDWVLSEHFCADQDQTA